MTRREKFALALHAVPTLGLLGQGLVYVTATTFMPYHADALASRWDDLPPHHRGFVLGVIKGMGAGSVAVSLALLILLAVPFRRGERWAKYAVPLIGIVFTALTAYAAYTIDVLTPASTPWRATCGLTALYVAGGVVSLWPLSSKR